MFGLGKLWIRTCFLQQVNKNFKSKFANSQIINIILIPESALEVCDLCLVVGTSSVVYPAAMFAPQVASRGVPVAEFNIEKTPATHDFRLVFKIE